MELDAINGFRISSFWIPHYEEHRCFRNCCAEMVMSVQSGYLAFAWEKCGAFYDSTKMKQSREILNIELSKMSNVHLCSDTSTKNLHEKILQHTLFKDTSYSICIGKTVNILLYTRIGVYLQREKIGNVTNALSINLPFYSLFVFHSIRFQSNLINWKKKLGTNNQK